MSKSETDQIINAMLSRAKENYEYDRIFNNLLAETKKKLEDDPDLFYAELQKDFKECFELLNDPEYIQDKDLALSVCHILIRLSVETGGMKEGSIAHLLGLRLYDYIDRINTR
jgi:hypothetical protein